jgi:nucleoside-diphosphate-sugar epimerase
MIFLVTGKAGFIGSHLTKFIYVKDVVRAFSQALKANVTPSSSLICNLIFII